MRRLVKRCQEKLEEAKRSENFLEFNAILDTLEEKVSAISALNEKILSQTDAASIEEEVINSEEYSLELGIELRKYRAYKSAWEIRVESQPDIHISQHTRLSHTEPQQTTSTVDPLVNISATSSASSQFHRLPKLSFPTFDGDILKWQSFWDTFESTIHFNTSLTDVQKFNYLRSQTEGEAASTIEGFALTNANYARALELLKERFGQKHKIISCTMQALLNIPAPSNTLHSLRKFYDRMENHIRSLESLGQC